MTSRPGVKEPLVTRLAVALPYPPEPCMMLSCCPAAVYAAVGVRGAPGRSVCWLRCTAMPSSAHTQPMLTATAAYCKSASAAATSPSILALSSLHYRAQSRSDPCCPPLPCTTLLLFSLHALVVPASNTRWGIAAAAADTWYTWRVQVGTLAVRAVGVMGPCRRRGSHLSCWVVATSCSGTARAGGG